MQRSTAARRSPPSAARVNEGSSGTQRRTRTAQVQVERQRVHDDARIQHVAGIPGRLPRPEGVEQVGARTSGPGARSAPARRRARRTAIPPCATTRSAAASMNDREARLPARPVQPEAHAQVDAALAEVPVRHAAQLVGLQERPGARRGTGPGAGAGPRHPRTRARPGRRPAGARRGRRRPRGRATAPPGRPRPRAVGRRRPRARCPPRARACSHGRAWRRRRPRRPRPAATHRRAAAGRDRASPRAGPPSGSRP